jgi:hypothetical protein
MTDPLYCICNNQYRNHHFFHRIRIHHTQLLTSLNFRSITHRFHRLSSQYLSFYVFFTRFCLPYHAKCPPDIANSMPHTPYCRTTDTMSLWTSQSMKSPFLLITGMQFTPEWTKAGMEMRPPHMSSAPLPQHTQTSTSRPSYGS